MPPEPGRRLEEHVRACLRHPSHPRRSGARPDHRGDHPADLPGLHARAGRHRRTSATGTSTTAAGNPTRSSLETQLAALEGGERRAVVRLGPRGGRRAAARHPEAGRPHRARQRRLRRHLPPAHPGARAVGHRDDHGRAVATPTRCVRRIRPDDEDRLGGDARATRCSRSSTSPRLAEIAHAAGALAGRRQHLRLARAAAAALTRRRRGRALHHEVPRRALRRARRCGGVRATTASSSRSSSSSSPSVRSRRPLDAWLTTRGIKTLAVRMRQHSENAQAIAEWAASRPGVRRPSTTRGSPRTRATRSPRSR